MTLTALLAWAATWASCWLLAGQQPPHVNEAHYLCKAKHFYEPDFARGDLFLESQDAHWLFFATLGRMTQSTTLEQTAWFGRWIVWGLISAALVIFLASCDVHRAWWAPAAVLSLALWQLTPMAGEWVVGGVEGKGPAFGLGLLSLALAARGRWRMGLLTAGAATAWHPLVGGWLGLLLGAGLLRLEGWSSLARPSTWVAGALALALASVGLLPALTLAQAGDPALGQTAVQVYVYDRLSHHLIFQRFPPYLITRHLMLWVVFGGLFVAQSDDTIVRRVGVVTWGAGALVVMGIALSFLSQWQPEWAARWLRYYWFRTSDWLLPPVTVVLLTRLGRRRATRRTSLGWLFYSACTLLLLGASYSELEYRWRDVPPAAQQSGLARRMSHDDARGSIRQWKTLCRWIRQNTAPGSVFLTPRRQQTFKWYAGRAEVVNWKDVPQDAASLVEWKRRYDAVFPPHVLARGLTAHSPQRLQELGARYGARWIVVDRRRGEQDLPWRPAFPVHLTEDTRFALYQIPPTRSVDGE